MSVRLSSVDAREDLVFPLPEDWAAEPRDSFVSTVSVIGGKCSSVWDCGDQVSGEKGAVGASFYQSKVGAWISETLTKKKSGLRLIYHYSEQSRRTHSPKVAN